MSDLVKRQPVNYRYDGLNWEFLKLLAEIGHYAGSKYGSPEQYTNGRLEGEKSPMNHIPEHMRQYIAREPHDHFGDIKYHLAAIAYNAMIEYFYLTHGGPTTTDAFVGGSLLDYAAEVKEIVEEHETGLDRVIENAKRQAEILLEPCRGCLVGGDAIHSCRGQGSGPLPGRNINVVQEEDKTKFITPPQTEPSSILARLFSKN